MSQYFLKSCSSHFGNSIKVKIDLSNYAKKKQILKVYPTLILKDLH